MRFPKFFAAQSQENRDLLVHVGTITTMPTPYPENPERLFALPEDAELDRLAREWTRESFEMFDDQVGRGWGDRSVCLGPDGPTDLPDFGVARRSQG